jgi:hypothetical protein
MTIEERKADIIGTNGIDASELITVSKNSFSSIELYLIIHMTNAELYYGDYLKWCFHADEVVSPRS